MPDPAGEGGGRTEHGPSSADEQRGCRSQCAGLACGGPHACVVRLASAAPRTCSCLVSQTRSLTDAMNALYPCLSNHALRWLKVSEAAPASKQTPGLLLEITRDVTRCHGMSRRCRSCRNCHQLSPTVTELSPNCHQTVTKMSPRCHQMSPSVTELSPPVTTDHGASRALSV